VTGPARVAHHAVAVLVTLIAAAVGPRGEVWMSCDSDNVDGHGRPWPYARKVLTLPVEGAGQALLGHSGRASVHDRVRIRLRRQGLPIPSAYDGPDDWADALAESVEQLARESPSLAEDGEVDARWLLGWAGRLWLIEDGAAQPAGRYSALGSGGDVALGVLYALLENDPEADVAGAVRTAAAAAIRWNGDCRGQALIHELPGA